MFDWLVVGAGFAGSVLAERLASVRNERVLVVDQRRHIGGNAFDYHDDAGILVHRYGPHIFHTNAPAIVEYLSRFTGWRPYEHRVRGLVDGMLVPIPVNRTTIRQLYGLDLDEAALASFYRSRAEPRAEIRTAEDVVVSQIGFELYEKFFKHYTRKQWGCDPSMLDKSVTARIPLRTNSDDRYFTDSFQAMPRLGYTAMFERMLHHPNIDVMLDTAYQDVSAAISFRRVIYTGPVDEYFGYRLGRLPYRSLRFEHRTLDMPNFQPVATVNYPQTEAYTRITEFKHLTGQDHSATSIVYEYPSAIGDPYYPVPNADSAALYKQYEALARRERDVWFAGRLATYRYYNMDQVVGQALSTFRKIQDALPVSSPRQRPAQDAALNG